MNSMAGDKDVLHNGSGAVDPTAYSAIKKVDRDKEHDEESKRFFKLLYTIFDICELSGFNLEGRITLRDNKTGRLWR